MLKNSPQRPRHPLTVMVLESISMPRFATNEQTSPPRVAVKSCDPISRLKLLSLTAASNPRLPSRLTVPSERSAQSRRISNVSVPSSQLTAQLPLPPVKISLPCTVTESPVGLGTFPSSQEEAVPTVMAFLREPTASDNLTLPCTVRPAPVAEVRAADTAAAAAPEKAQPPPPPPPPP